MGADLFDARPDLLVDTADDVLGWSLRELCLDGPIEHLSETDKAQPGLYALSVVLWEEFERSLASSHVPMPSAAAGHSLGEFSALGAAGSFGFAAGLKLVATRGLAMATAATAESSSMAALLGADDQLAEKIASDRRSEGGRLWVANLNAPGQVVMAGSASDIVWLTDSASRLGVRRVIELNVAGAFHSPYMEPAVARVKTALDKNEFHALRFDVWSNVTAAPLQPEMVAELALRQLTSPVRFSESLAGIQATGVDTFVHVGPGNLTAGMAKRAAPGSRILVVNGLGSIDDAVAALGEAIL